MNDYKTVELEKIATTVPVAVELLGDPVFWGQMQDRIKTDVLESMSKLGTVVGNLEVTVLRPHEWNPSDYGVDGIPNYTALIVFTALAVPHGKVEADG